jgi:hypothetical protein
MRDIQRGSGKGWDWRKGQREFQRVGIMIPTTIFNCIEGVRFRVLLDVRVARTVEAAVDGCMQWWVRLFREGAYDGEVQIGRSDI